MSLNQISSKASDSVALKAISTIGVIAFTAFMANSWHRQLSEFKSANETNTPTNVAPDNATAAAPSTSESQIIVASTAPVATNATAPATTEAAYTMTETAPEAVTEAAPEISEPAALQALEKKLYEEINQTWETYPTFSNHLVYQVNVKQDGAIASYDSVNQAAQDYLNETPLPRLSNLNNSEPSEMSPDPIAKFLVVMTPSGVLEVSPWVAQ